MTLGDLAAAYTYGGWYVFPLRAGMKTPATANGFKDATLDRAKIGAYWSRHPEANIGIATGASRLLVVDLDAEEGTCAAALELFHGLGEVPYTYRVTTPRGGEHHYFTLPEGVDVPCSASRVGYHIDIRSTGGYVVAAGSVTPLGAYVEFDAEVAPAPGWLIEACQRRPAPASGHPKTVAVDHLGAYASRALDAEIARVLLAREGVRNHTLNEAAFNLFQLVAGGVLDSVTAFDALYMAARGCGLDAREITNTIESGAEAGSRYPRRPDDG